MLEDIWNKSKGKIAVVAVTFMLGVPAAAGFLGIEQVTGPESAVCFAASKNETE